MLHFTSGDLFESKAEAWVNAVNTVGVMGKGIALLFKRRFPENFTAYASACKAGEVVTGQMFVTERAAADRPRWIINFPTKTHFRSHTRLDWVDLGLADLAQVIGDQKMRSVALPAIGCGLGGLQWSEVRPLIETHLGVLDAVTITVFEPQG